ncbi:M28 family peptidase [Solimonas terrae]|uniref:Zn-dependent exopeptidase M28 n=1 Tax=Solimonas terrae TaxID=1396819 RepID=A0A6M2BLX6_9GAMM|nr:M28 family peptidase [Solimonas terrae]NGY03271.1 Zn-dependent exopeptidase M28 [Solimonas terrae]
MKTAYRSSAALLASVLLTSCVVSFASTTQLVREAAPEPAALTGADAYWQLLRYSAIGLHRSGTDGGERVVNFLDQSLRGFGLEPQIEPFDFPQFVPRTVALQLDDGSDVKVFPYWYSGRTGSDGVRAPLVDVGSGTQAEFDAAKVSGRIVLAGTPLQLRAFMPTLPAVMKRAQAAGALGVVAATTNAPGNLIVAANADSAAGLCGLPVLFVGAEDGARLRAMSGRIVRFTLDAELRGGQSANVVATIPGKSTDTLVIGTPTNGWFTSASERGAGVGVLLTLARHYAARRAEAGAAPDKTLVFVFSGGHEVGYLGLERYIEAHPEVIAKTYTYVHLGAGVAGRYYFQQPDGAITAAPIADPSRFLFVSENPLLQQMVSKHQLSSGLMPAQSILPSVLNPGEQQRMYARGVPIISISGTTLFFHTEADTADTSSAELLDPAVRFYASVIDDLLAADPAEVLRNNKLAVGYAKPVPAPACVVPGVQGAR